MDNSNSNGRFNVVVRIRPIIEEDNNQVLTEEDLYLCVNKIVRIMIKFKSDTKLSIVRPTVEEREYDFDNVMGNMSSQEQSYDIIARKVVNDVMEGYNGTIMAYGQVFLLIINRLDLVKHLLYLVKNPRWTIIQ